MSGFAGLVSLDGALPDRRLLEQMAARLEFRGPDGTHIWAQPGAGFSFTFLRTGPAPQCRTQPCSLDGRVWLLGDVRLDRREDLRRDLEAVGESFHEDVGNITDEELVLRAWRRRGEDCLPGLMGDLSLALWDAEARRLVCVRDLMGARPFFYAHVGPWLYFSNTLNAVRCSQQVSPELDLHYIGDFLLQGWCPDLARTAFRNISRLAPGHILRYSSSGLEVRRYTTLPIEEPLWLKRDEEYVERFRELLEQAVLDRLPRGRAAIFMSGGLDSTSVAAVAVDSARKRGQPLDLCAHTVDYQPLFDDQEGRLAKLAADYLGIPIEVRHCASHPPFSGCGKPELQMPEPNHSPLVAVHIDQIREIATHGCVALNGYGGDGILTGQSWPFLVDLLRHGSVGRVATAFGGYLLKHGRIPPLRGGFRARSRKLLHRADPMEDYPAWLAPDFEKNLRLRERWNELRQPPRQLHPWYPDAYAVLTEASWSTTMELEDAAWSGVAVEARSPFLDLRIQRFLLRVPPLPLCIDKELLRRATDGLLPSQIRKRPKTPLLGDPVVLHAKSGDWTPLPLSPNSAIRRFVECGKLSETLEQRLGHNPWRDLRPVTLLYWFRGIESSRPIA